MEALLSLSLGLGLAAACGFRIFVPMLVMSVASRAGHLELGAGFDWIESDVALVALGLATLLEIGAYYVPWLDNLLDTVAGPAAVIAGIIVTASAVSGMSPMLKWTLAVIAGGGVAAVVQAGTTLVRQLSTVTTLGFGNPIVSTIEAGGAIALASLAVIAPVVAGLTVVGGVIVLIVWLVQRFRHREVAA